MLCLSIGSEDKHCVFRFLLIVPAFSASCVCPSVALTLPFQSDI